MTTIIIHILEILKMFGEPTTIVLLILLAALIGCALFYFLRIVPKQMENIQQFRTSENEYMKTIFQELLNNSKEQSDKNFIIQEKSNSTYLLMCESNKKLAELLERSSIDQKDTRRAVERTLEKLSETDVVVDSIKDTVNRSEYAQKESVSRIHERLDFIVKEVATRNDVEKIGMKIDNLNIKALQKDND